VVTLLKAKGKEMKKLSKAKKEWIRSTTGWDQYSNSTKFSIIYRALSGIRNPHRTTETLLDEALRADKLHDGHPQIIVEAIEDLIPDFFKDLPTEGTPDMIRKKAFISEFITCEVRNGETRYDKPNLRKNKSKAKWADDF